MLYGSIKRMQYGSIEYMLYRRVHLAEKPEARKLQPVGKIKGLKSIKHMLHGSIEYMLYGRIKHMSQKYKIFVLEVFNICYRSIKHML